MPFIKFLIVHGREIGHDRLAFLAEAIDHGRNLIDLAQAAMFIAEADIAEPFAVVASRRDKKKFRIGLFEYPEDLVDIVILEYPLIPVAVVLTDIRTRVAFIEPVDIFHSVKSPAL